MILRDHNLRFALLKAVADAINDELAGERSDHTLALRERYDDEGVKAFDVKLPAGGGKVATISLSVPKATTKVVDADAYTAWCRVNMPTAVTEHTTPAGVAWVETIQHPATPAETVYSVDPGMTNVLLAGASPVGGPGEVVDEDGLIIDGVEYTPAGKPKSFSVRYERAGREALALAYRDGRLDHLLGGSTLPALEPPHPTPMRPPIPPPTPPWLDSYTWPDSSTGSTW